MSRVRMIMIAALALGAAAPAVAQDWKDLRAAGKVGEQSDGYLAVVGNDAALQRIVDAVNISRKRAYTQDVATAGEGTVEAMALTTGCNLIQELKAGQKYRMAGPPPGPWLTVGQGELQLDPRCKR